MEIYKAVFVFVIVGAALGLELLGEDRQEWSRGC